MASNAYTVHPRPEDIAIDEAKRAMLRDIYNSQGKWWRTRKRPIRRIALVTIDGKQHTVHREKDGSWRFQKSTGLYLQFADFRQFYVYLQACKAAAYQEHYTRLASTPAPLGRVMNKSQFVHPDIEAHMLTTYAHGLKLQRIEYGMAEAARRSQSAPGWLRWETIQVQPAPNLSIVKGFDAKQRMQALAADLGTPERLKTAAQKSPEELAAWMRRWRVAHGFKEDAA
jgi:hypothetical protein